MQNRFAITFLAITLIAVMMVGMQIEPVDALKSHGTHIQKYGSATKHIVCGDRLCDEENTPKQSPDITTEPTKTSMCNRNSIQMESSCMSFNIDGGTVKGSTYDNMSGSTTIQIQTANDGHITINTALDTAFILVDGEEWNDVIISDSSTVIEFFAGTETIQIFEN